MSWLELETYLTCGFLSDPTDNPLDALHPDLQLHVGGGGDDDREDHQESSALCWLSTCLTGQSVPTPSLPPHISLASAWTGSSSLNPTAETNNDVM